MSTPKAYELQSHVAGQERRKYPRVKATVIVELKPQDAAAAIRTQTSDISLGGCYVEMNFTLPVSTEVDLVLWLGDQRVLTKGRIATHHPCFGNGIQFVDMSADGQSKLKGFLSSVEH